MATWSGIHTTPRTTILIDRLIEEEENQDQQTELASVLVDYEVPMKDKSRQHLEALNWPKAYFVGSLSPCEPGQSRRGRLLELLGKHSVPSGTQDKYFNTIAFYDLVVDLENLTQTFGKRHPQ